LTRGSQELSPGVSAPSRRSPWQGDPC
jgi:hypothetical protein